MTRVHQCARPGCLHRHIQHHMLPTNLPPAICGQHLTRVVCFRSGQARATKLRSSTVFLSQHGLQSYTHKDIPTGAGGSGSCCVCVLSQLNKCLWKSGIQPRPGMHVAYVQRHGDTQPQAHAPNLVCWGAAPDATARATPCGRHTHNGRGLAGQHMSALGKSFPEAPHVHPTPHNTPA
jgi:hypothetical protein